MKYAVKMGSGAKICTQSFIKVGPAIQKLMEGGYTDTQRVWRSLKPTFVFQNKESRLKIYNFPII
jgi:hypothetical protein